MAWMWSYEYIAQTTGKDAGKNGGDLLQVTFSPEFVGLGDPGTSCSFAVPGQRRALSSAATQLKDELLTQEMISLSGLFLLNCPSLGKIDKNYGSCRSSW